MVQCVHVRCIMHVVQHHYYTVISQGVYKFNQTNFQLSRRHFSKIAVDVLQLNNATTNVQTMYELRYLNNDIH